MDADKIEKLKQEVIAAAAIYFGAVAHGPGFTLKLDEIFDEAKKEENDQPPED